MQSTAQTLVFTVVALGAYTDQGSIIRASTCDVAVHVFYSDS